MKPIKPIDLSSFASHADVVVKGEIYDSDDTDVLLQDLLEIGLPSGNTIDVGWYPEHDPNGQYRVILYRDFTGDPFRRYETPDVYVAIEKAHAWMKDDKQPESNSVSISMDTTYINCPKEERRVAYA